MKQKINKVNEYLSKKDIFGLPLLTISRETGISPGDLRKILEQNPQYFKQVGISTRFAANKSPDSNESMNFIWIITSVAILCNLIVIFIASTRS
jgi:hypothetical protein